MTSPFQDALRAELRVAAYRDLIASAPSEAVRRQVGVRGGGGLRRGWGRAPLAEPGRRGRRGPGPRRQRRGPPDGPGQHAARGGGRDRASTTSRSRWCTCRSGRASSAGSSAWTSRTSRGRGWRPSARTGSASRGSGCRRDGREHWSSGSGRRRSPGEAYGVGSDAFAAGEPLDCKGVLGSTLDAARGPRGAVGPGAAGRLRRCAVRARGPRGGGLLRVVRVRRPDAVG